MKIIKYKKTSKDKYKVYLEDKSCIEIYEDVIIKNNLLLKKEISNSLIKDIEKQNKDEFVYNLALSYFSIRIRSKKEIIDYLKKKDISFDVINKTVLKLEKNNILNDSEYAKCYVSDQLLLTNNGPLKIKNNLIQNNINGNIINEVMGDIDYDKLNVKLEKLIIKYISKKKGSINSIKLKTINYFINLGYYKEDILKIISKIIIKSDDSIIQKEYEKLINKYSKKYNGSELIYFVINKLYQKGYTKEEIQKLKKKD